MNRPLDRGGAHAITLPLALAAAMVWATVSANAASLSPSPRATATLAIQTIPTLAGIVFLIDNRPHVTGASGEIAIRVTLGQHRVVPVGPEHPAAGEHVRFSLWSVVSLPTDAEVDVPQKGLDLEAGFVVTRPIRVRLLAPDGDVVSTKVVRDVEVTGDTGARYRFSPLHPPSQLPANWDSNRDPYLISIPIRYRIESVVLDGGGNAVFAGRQSFFLSQTGAARSSTWVIHLTLLRLRVVVRDAIFRFNFGAAVKVLYPDGHGRIFTLGPSHEVSISNLSRGHYQLVAKGGGFGLTSAAALSRPQTATVLIVSYLDIATAILVIMLFLVGLPLLGRRLLRPRPTPGHRRRAGLPNRRA